MNLESKKPTIFLISGKARHGKTTLGNFIKKEYELENKKVGSIAIVKYLKMYAKDYFGWDGKEESKPRDLLQNLGTEIIRFKLNKPDFFINRTIEDLEILSYFFDCLIIDDIRIPEELESIKKVFNKTVTIKIKRKNLQEELTEEQKQHYTEIALDNYENFDYIIDNDSDLNDLEEKTKQLIYSIKKEVDYE